MAILSILFKKKSMQQTRAKSTEWNRFFLHAKKWFFLVFERPLGGKFVKDFELAQSNDWVHLKKSVTCENSCEAVPLPCRGGAAKWLVALGRRQPIAYLRHASSSAAPTHQPFRRTYGTAAWLATIIWCLWHHDGRMANRTSIFLLYGRRWGCRVPQRSVKYSVGSMRRRRLSQRKMLSARLCALCVSARGQMRIAARRIVQGMVAPRLW